MRLLIYSLNKINRLIDAKVANSEAQKALDEWNAQNRQLEALRQDLQDDFSEEKAQRFRQFEAQVNAQREPLINQYPELAELLEITPEDLAQLQKNIAKDTLVIQPVFLTGIDNVEDTIALFLITQDSFKVIQQKIDAPEINQLITDYKTQLEESKGLGSNYLETSSQLYNLLIRPIEQEITALSPQKLAFITTGQLRGIPLESLYDETTDQYLLAKYPIHYLTRISTTKLYAESPQKSPFQVLAFANPQPTNVNLLGTEKQAEYIKVNFPDSETYLREKATLDNFKKQSSQFPILHLGTHGCFQPQGCQGLNMEANTLLFANNETYHIRDAALLGLNNTELVIFSACQTAKEISEEDQGLAGLAYVFERAGVKSIMGTLWISEDKTSLDVMTQFYDYLSQGMSKSEALQKAKLNQSHRHPFFWSVFILIGEEGE